MSTVFFVIRFEKLKNQSDHAKLLQSIKTVRFFNQSHFKDYEKASENVFSGS